MTTATARRRAAPSTRDRLIRVALEQFQARGYSGAGLADLLQRAGAAKGSFYHHFPGGKEELAVAAVQWLQDRVTGYLDRLSADGAGCALIVEALVRFSVEGARRGRLPRGSLVAVLAQDVAPASPAVAAAIRAFTAEIRDHIAAARAAESPTGDAARFAELALAVVEGATVLARVEGQPERASVIVEGWLQTVTERWP